MKRAYKTFAALSTGGILLGVLQAFSMVSFAQAITDFLSTFLSLLVTVLFGIDPNNLDLVGGFGA